jgi:kynureninase
MKGWNERAKALQQHYAQFRVSQRILLTGHSHQAWPDIARDAQLEAFDDAANWVDDKWPHAFEKAECLRQFYLRNLGDTQGEIALGTNTQELLVRWISALPLGSKKQIVTTDGEFHSMRRLLDRLNETSVEVIKVSAEPVAT